MANIARDYLVIGRQEADGFFHAYVGFEVLFCNVPDEIAPVLAAAFNAAAGETLYGTFDPLSDEIGPADLEDIYF